MDIGIFLETVKVFSIWLFDEFMTDHHWLQLVFVAISFVIALYIGRYAQQRFHDAKVEIGPRHRLIRTIFRLIRRLAFPSAMLGIITLFIIGLEIFNEPHRVLDTANALVLALVIIRLGSVFIQNPTIGYSISTLVWIITALSILGYLPLVIEWMQSIRIGQDETSLSLYDIVSSVISVAAFMWIALFLASLLERSFQNNNNLTPSTRALFAKISKFSLIGIAFVMGLNTVGIDLTAFAIFGGAIGVGIGLGLQKVFSNLIAGIILLVDKSIKPGDTLYVNQRYGKVDKLSGRYVSMITRDGTEHLIPNDDLINNQVENWSYSDPKVRLRIPVGVHYDSDVPLAIKLCIEAAAETPRVIDDPEPNCLLKGFGDNSVDLEVRIWVADPMNGCANVKSKVMLKIWEKFHEYDIEIPYPQRDLHVRSVDGITMQQLTRQHDMPNGAQQETNA